MNHNIEEVLAAFDDSADKPTFRAADGRMHDDPYCGNAAPIGSIESVHGEPCGICQRAIDKTDEKFNRTTNHGRLYG